MCYMDALTASFEAQRQKGRFTIIFLKVHVVWF